jgi:nitric oxide reductase large subunit
MKKEWKQQFGLSIVCSLGFGVWSLGFGVWSSTRNIQHKVFTAKGIQPKT